MSCTRRNSLTAVWALIGAIAVMTLLPSAGIARPVYGPPAMSDGTHFRLDYAPRAIDLSPDGTKLAVLDMTHQLHVVSVATGEPIGFAALDDSACDSVVFSPNGQFVFAAGGEQVGGRLVGELIVFDLHAKRITHRVLGPGSSIDSMILSRNGLSLITGSDDGTVAVWDARTRKTLRTFAPPRTAERQQATILAMTCSADDSKLAIRDQSGLRLISTTSGKSLGAKHMDLVSLAFGGAGSNLATSIWYDDTPDDSVAALRILQAPSLRMLDSVRVAAQAGWYLHDLAPVPGLAMVAGVTDRGFAVWNATSGALVAQAQTPEIIRSISFSADGQWFAYVDVRGMVEVVPTLALLTGRLPA